MSSRAPTLAGVAMLTALMMPAPVQSADDADQKEAAESQTTDESASNPADEAGKAGDEPTTEESDGETDVDASMPDLSAPARGPADFRLSVGPLVAGRSMTFEGDTGTIRHRPNPYLGTMASASGRLATFDKIGAHLTFEADFGYGISTNTLIRAPGLDRTTTELTYGGGRLFIKRQLSDVFTFGFGTGFQATSVIVDPNPEYTGHRYLAVDTALHARWFAIEDAFSMAFDLGAYPVFATDNSDGAHGTSTSFGVRAGTEATLALAPGATSEGLRGLHLKLRYRFQRFRSQFPVSPLGTRGAISRDNQHIGGLMIEYVFRSYD